MLTRYQVTVAAELARLFQAKFRANLEKRGYVRRMGMAPPGGPHVEEFRSEEEIVIFCLQAGKGEEETIIIESETPVNLEELVLSTVRDTVVELVDTFLAFLRPLGMGDREGIEHLVEELRKLQKEG